MRNHQVSARARRLLPQRARRALRRLVSSAGANLPLPIVDIEACEVRAYRAGDEHQILELLQLAFGVRRSLEEWRWRYLAGPHGAGRVSLVTARTGEIVAHYAGCPFEFQESEGGEIRSMRAMHIGDTMTAPAVRSMGRQASDLLVRAARHHFAAFSAGHVGFNFGFNTGAIQRFYLRGIEGSRFLEPVGFRAMAIDHATRRRLHEAARAIDEETVVEVREPDGQWDTFLERVQPHYGLLLRRDAAYVRWRYQDRPDIRYRLFALHTRDHLTAWGAFRRLGGRLVWGDGLCDPRLASALPALLGRVLDRSDMQDVERIEGWFPARPRWSADAMSGLGFDLQPEPDGLGLIYLPFLESDIGERLRERLYYTMGDSDLF